jgi:hypothetical protein
MVRYSEEGAHTRLHMSILTRRYIFGIMDAYRGEWTVSGEMCCARCVVGLGRGVYLRGVTLGHGAISLPPVASLGEAHRRYRDGPPRNISVLRL